MRKNIVRQSETFRRRYCFRNAQTGAIPDLTDCLAFCQMRTRPNGELIATANCSIDVSYGRINVLWTAEQTADIPVGTYYFEVWLKCGDEQKPFATEQVEIVPAITEIEGV